MKENKVAVIIKTAPNRKSLLWLLNSIELTMEDVEYRLYIADEHPVDEWKTDLYEKLKDQGHFIKVWDGPVAVTVARNALIDNLKDEQYVLRVDDDFELSGEFNITCLLKVLENQSIDFCCDIERQIGEGKNIKSGDLRIKSGDIILKNNGPSILHMKDDSSWRYNEYRSTRYAYANYMRNLILLKRNCFEKVRWNENLNFSGEHLDFFMSLKEAGFQGAFTPDSIHLHRDDLKKISVNIQEEVEWRQIDLGKVKKNEFNKRWGGIPKKRYGIIKDGYSLLRKKTAILSNIISRRIKE
ncbi:MAG: glycosyltransferase family A protein [Balneolales bacterium]